MYENQYMYAIERSDEYLAHYGIRGMKWGVRKAIQSGNSRRLGRQYAKAQKKLAKLDKRAAKASKYGRRAALMGAGAAVAGGAAALGTKGVVDIMGHATRGTRKLGAAMMNVRGSNQVAHKIRNAGVALNRAGTPGGAVHDTMLKGATAINKWGNSNSIANKMSQASGHLGTALKNTRGNSALAANMRKAGVDLTTNPNSLTGKLSRMNNNTYARIGAGVIGAGLAAGAAKNAYRAATAKKKAAKFRSEMNKAFAGTKYANGGGGSKPRQGKKRRRNG